METNRNRSIRDNATEWVRIARELHHGQNLSSEAVAIILAAAILDDTLTDLAEGWLDAHS